MSNKWKNIISAFIACIIAYLCGVSVTDSWYIIKDTPSEDVNVIVTMLFVFVGSFAVCRFFIEMLDCN
jgi:divalent metal cation (Fe/Co/Zn/Cd) transporter